MRFKYTGYETTATMDEILQQADYIYKQGNVQIYAHIGFWALFRKIDIKDRAMKKARKRRLRNKYLQRRARG